MSPTVSEDIHWGELGLREDPFPIEAPEKVNYWADNAPLLQTLIRTQVEAVLSSSSSMYAFYGHLGAGKTHAIRYLSNEETQRKIQKRISGGKERLDIMSIAATAPVPGGTGELTDGVYKQVVSALLRIVGKNELKSVAKLTADRADTTPLRALHDLATRFASQTMLEEVKLSKAMRDTPAWKYIIGGRANPYGVLENTVEMAELLSTLVKSIVSPHRRIIIWIDELENLRSGSATERRLFSDLVRKTFDDTDRGLSIFLVFTLETFGEVEELLLPAIWSRIGPERTIQFQLMKTVSDLVSYFDVTVESRGGIKPSELADKAAVEVIAKRLLEMKGAVGVSPRDFNLYMRSVLSSLLAFPGRGKGKLRLTAKLLKQLDEAKSRIVADLSKELVGG